MRRALDLRDVRSKRIGMRTALFLVRVSASQILDLHPPPLEAKFFRSVIVLPTMVLRYAWLVDIAIYIDSGTLGPPHDIGRSVLVLLWFISLRMRRNAPVVPRTIGASTEVALNIMPSTMRPELGRF